MSKWKRILACGFALLMMKDNIINIHAQQSTIKIGVRSDIVNYSYYDEKNKQYYGFEIDLANQLAEDLGYENVKFIQVKPSNRKEKLLNKEVDCLIATYSISDTRKENFDFSPTYYSDETKIMVEKSSLISQVNDLEGKNIGILNGSNAGPLLSAKLSEEGIISSLQEDNDLYTQYDHLRLTRYNSYKEMSTALESGEVDALCMDGVIAQMYMDDSRQCLDINVAQQNYGVATRKGSSLTKAISKQIKAYRKDGMLKKLKDKWD